MCQEREEGRALGETSGRNERNKNLEIQENLRLYPVLMDFFFTEFDIHLPSFYPQLLSLLPTCSSQKVNFVSQLYEFAGAAKNGEKIPPMV